MNRRLFFGLVVIMFGLFISCDSSQDMTSRIVVSMVDSPGDYDEVNIDVQTVELHISSTETDGWITLDNPNTGVVNILELTNGVSLIIGDSEIPAGRLSQMRVILGENNSLVIGDEIHDLKVPSGSQSGLKLQIQETLEEGITYQLKLDFDASKSIVRRGNGGYILKPVINVIEEAVSGAIRGNVEPAAENIAVYAIQENDTIRSSYAGIDQSGYLLEGLPEGTYRVAFDPGSDSSLSGTEVENVEVTIGQTTTIQTVTLQ